MNKDDTIWLVMIGAAVVWMIIGLISPSNDGFIIANIWIVGSMLMLKGEQ